jgi:transcriptional regulator with XRE-family HTH domain
MDEAQPDQPNVMALLKNKMAELKLTQKVVADAFGVRQSWLSKAMSGRLTVSADKLTRISSLFKAAPVPLCTIVPEPQTPTPPPLPVPPHLKSPKARSSHAAKVRWQKNFSSSFTGSHLSKAQFITSKYIHSEHRFIW